jgi:hypothetical protein
MWGEMKERECCGWGSGGGAGQLQCLVGMDSARLSCEARFELRNPAWLRAIFRMSATLLRWDEPT